MSDTVVDTCCLVNLCALGEPTRYLPAFGLTWQLPAAVAAEGLFIRAEKDGGRAKKRRIDLEPSIAARVVLPCDIVGLDEADLHVRLARDLDDGEAMALAIAKSRGWALATDDRKGRRKASEIDVPVITTPQLMRRWAERNRVVGSDLSEALMRIQTFAKFIPAPDFPEHAWWSMSLNSAG